MSKKIAEVATLNEWAEFIWNDLLEGDDAEERHLSCGCIVHRDDSAYLYLYAFNEGWAGNTCEDPVTHQVIWRMIYLAKLVGNFDAPLPGDEREELVRAVRNYTVGWSEQADLLKKIGAGERNKAVCPRCGKHEEVTGDGVEWLEADEVHIGGRCGSCGHTWTIVMRPVR